MTLYQSAQNYIAAHLLHGCPRAHQALLPSYPALPSQFRSRCPVAQPMSRFDIQVLSQGFSTVHTLPWPNQPLCTRLLFADCRPLHITQRYKSQGFVTSSRDATLPTRAITVSLLWLQCTIASSTPTVQSLRPVAHVRVGLFICLLFVVYLLNIFNFHWSSYLSFFLSLLTLIYIGARGGKRIQIYDHTSQFLLLNTFLSIAYFAWGGVINLLCMPWPNTLVAEGRIH